ncbi:MAG: nucleotidyl transferase AbiEii/AbiGii toxin family protein [Bryobacteraceae bacterium]|nr:nucleotidyl transferase AbiEii/AbiGii toxin family protein [Bryobacteraceae bacterium]
MNPGFLEFLGAGPEDRRDAFLETSRRLGTPEQNVEKDFWVTWTLDVLFNSLPDRLPRLLFKGGTSLSKAYGLISRSRRTSTLPSFEKTSGRLRPLKNWKP